MVVYNLVKIDNESYGFEFLRSFIKREDAVNAYIAEYKELKEGKDLDIIHEDESFSSGNAHAIFEYDKELLLLKTEAE